jgi:translocator protein
MIPADPFYAGLLGGALFSILLAVAGGVLTRLSPWYYALRQPTWKPPDWAFGPIWTLILTLLAFAIAYAWQAADTGQRQQMLWALLANGIFHVAWSGIFFMLQQPKLAFIELLVFWLSILGLIWVLGSISRTAGLLLLPYILWVTIAGALNFQIVRLNRT